MFETDKLPEQFIDRWAAGVDGDHCALVLGTAVRAWWAAPRIHIM